MKSLLVLFTILRITKVIYCQVVQTKGYYNVIGSKVIRPNGEYHAAISIHATAGPTFITAILQGSAFGLETQGSSIIETCKDVVQPYSTTLCRFEIGNIQNGNYMLQVTGKQGLDFFTEFPLQYVNKSYSVFIQTDKAVYEPGSTVQFRVIVLNPALKPAAEIRNEFLFIYILDGQGNRVKEWKNVAAIKGVFSDNLPLSLSPVLGHWNVSVIFHGQAFHKSFEVAEYIRPKFIVDIRAPKHVTFNKNILTIDVEARYDYGKNVKGEATITAYPTISSGIIQPIFQNPIRKVIKINGSTTIEFDIVRDLGLNDEYERTVIIDAVVEEEFTGRRQNNSAETLIHKYDYKMEIIKTADYFKPGLIYSAYIKVSNHDGSPIDKDQRDLTIRHGYTRVDETYKTNLYKLDDKGILELEYITPENVTNTTALRIEAKYNDLKERMPPVPPAVSYSNTFLQISINTSQAKVLSTVNVLVNCTKPMKDITYVLLAKGDVLLSRTFQIDNRKMFSFSFTAVQVMVPLSHLIVYYITDDGELIGDVLDIEVEDMFDNFVDIDINSDETEPDLDVELTIRTRPNSYIGLLGIDENLKNLKSGFDLSLSDITEELLTYDFAEKSPYLLAFNPKDNNYFSWKPGASNEYSGIMDSGAEQVTNARINRHKPTLDDVYLRPIFYGSSTLKPDRGIGLPFHSVTRPPLAGPYAFSRIPKPVWNKPKVYLTREVAQTWIFSNFSSGQEGKTTIRRKVPSGQTNWLISGFSLDPIRGLALMSEPKKLKVMKSFEIKIKLPYSVYKGEILAVPVLVLNNNNEDISVDITFHNTEQQFEFAEISTSSKKVELYQRKKVNVQKKSGTAVSFIISPRKEGIIDIKVTANSLRRQDSTVGKLRVKVEGETEYYVKSAFIDMRNTNVFKKAINFTIPSNAIEGSEQIEVSAGADLLGPAMIHLDDLIRLSTGCGEQNLVHIMPSLVILLYLTNTKQVNPTIENEALGFIEKGYQSQLSYKRKDGSFSPFGERDARSNVWLTAYVAMTLKHAKQFIYVDENIITTALDWLANHQSENGSFVESGNIIYDHLQNQNGKSLALTAFTILTFLENQKGYDDQYINVIYKGLDYITSNLDDNESTYSIAICNYVLHLAKHASRQSTFNLLESRAKKRDDMKFWAEDEILKNGKNPWRKLPRSIDIEMTSYAILTYIEANLIDDALPILNWLITQQNNLGGFTSSRDTVIGLQALYQMALKLASPSNLQIDYVYHTGKTGKFNIHSSNAMILQSTKIDKDARNVSVTAKGTGVGVFKVSYQYNMNVTGPWPSFTLDPQVDKNSNLDHLQLSICVAFVSKNLSYTPISNMAVLEVTLPSGFTADEDSLPSLEVSQNVQKVETSQEGTKVILYFYNLTINEYCPTVSAFRTHKVAKQKPVPVVIYDYYDTSRRARVFYRGPKSTLCNICEMEDCENTCSGMLERQRSSEKNIDDQDGGSGLKLQGTKWLVMCVILGMLLTR